jgi:elongation factor P
MADTSDIRNGLIMNMDGQYWAVQEFQHVKPGKGGAFIRTKLKNLLTSQVKDMTFRSGEKIIEVRVVRQPFQFLYKSGDVYHVMDRSTYEQLELPESLIDDARYYLKENMELDILMDGDKPLTLELPNFADLVVTRADPGIRGDTAQGGYKSATLETGLVVQVPLFLNEGDTVRIDTRTGKYVTRV